MKTTDLLEQDKEALVGRLSNTETTDQAITVLEEELNRILYRYQEASGAGLAGAPLTQTTALVSFDVARSALSLADGNGEIQIIQKTSLTDSGKGRHSSAAQFWSSPLLLTLSGISLGILSAVLFLLPSPGILSSLFSAAAFAAGGSGGFLLYRAGRQRALSGASPVPQNGSQVSVQVRPDPEKLYHHVKNLLTMIDQRIDESSARDALAAHAQSFPDSSQKDGTPSLSAVTPEASIPDLSDEELTLFSTLLEQAYALEDEPYAREIISQIRFHLHRHSVELEDFDPEKADTQTGWFDLMPAEKNETLRPALVRRTTDANGKGQLICKGFGTKASNPQKPGNMG